MKLEELAKKLDELKVYWEEEDISYDDRFNQLLFYVEKTLTNELLWVLDDSL
jgi:hypothetical protein